MGRVLLFSEEIAEPEAFDSLGFTIAICDQHGKEFKPGRFWYGHAEIISPDEDLVIDSYLGMFVRSAYSIAFQREALTDPQHHVAIQNFTRYQTLDTAISAYLDHPNL